MIPTMDRAREPMARMPSSNFSPSPKRLPMIRSMAPRAMKTTIRYTMISLTDIYMSPFL